MKNERQLEFNFDDPIEYLAPPTYFGSARYRISDKQLGAAVVHVETRVTVEHVPTDPETGRSGK